MMRKTGMGVQIGPAVDLIGRDQNPLLAHRKQNPIGLGALAGEFVANQHLAAYHRTGQDRIAPIKAHMLSAAAHALNVFGDRRTGGLADLIAAHIIDIQPVIARHDGYGPPQTVRNCQRQRGFFKARHALKMDGYASAGIEQARRDQASNFIVFKEILRICQTRPRVFAQGV